MEARRGGEIVVAFREPSTIECAGAGYLRRPAVTTAQQAIEKILAERDGVFDTIFDGSAIEGFELGLPMVWVRWSYPHLHRFRRSAIVGRPGPLLDVARPFPYLLPSLKIGLFESTDAARAFVARAAAD